MSNFIRVYDYVNHPYEKVKELLSTDANSVFRNATKVAALRGRTVASELHVNIAGIEIGTDISIIVKGIEDHPKRVMSPESTTIKLEWEAAKRPHLFPFMAAELKVFPLTPTETQLVLEGEYQPPLGVLGKALDAVAGKRIAEASVHQFIKDVAVYLREEFSALEA
ncbi:MAG: hypothetical protein R2681_03655 [Pyrinomonadaceae bacterium]